MNLQDNKKPSVLVEDTDQHRTRQEEQGASHHKIEKFKKPIIFALMAVVFAGCMYLIFQPKTDKKNLMDIGLNDSVPQATGAGMEADKQKAYEQAQAEKRAQEKRNALTSLSDYLNADSVNAQKINTRNEEENQLVASTTHNQRKNINVVDSYRNAKDALNTFYQTDHSETQDLRKQIEELKKQLSQKETAPPASNIDNQLTLMEKSYQMAAKYLPANMSSMEQPKTPATTTAPAAQKENFAVVTAARKNPVSALYREPSDSAFITSMSRVFNTAGSTNQPGQQRNSIRASVQETVLVTGESNVRLRLLDAVRIVKHNIPEGCILTANAKFQNGRLELKISSVEIDGNIIPVNINAYNLDGQPGLLTPYSPERTALTDIASNMSQTAGTSFMVTQSAGQQVAGDLSRGLLQGISGYLSKKIRTPKITLKAGLELLLVSKS